MEKEKNYILGFKPYNKALFEEALKQIDIQDLQQEEEDYKSFLWLTEEDYKDYIKNKTSELLKSLSIGTIQ